MNTKLYPMRLLAIMSIVLAAMVSTAHAQTGEDVGTVDLFVVDCSSVDATGVVSSMPADCVDSGGSFTFYLIGDDSADYNQLLVPSPDGRGNINLVPGDYEVVEENSQTHFNLTVASGETTQVIFAFVVDAPPPAQETVTLGLSSLVCENYEAASFVDFDGNAPSECTQVVDDLFTLYLYGDGTDDYVSVTTIANSPAFVELVPGTYKLIHEGTQMSTDLELVSGEYSIAFTKPLQEVVDRTPEETTPTLPSDSSEDKVTSLPETGVGTNTGMGTLLALTTTGIVLVAIAGGAVRRR